jgi:hypothetical protein
MQTYNEPKRKRVGKFLKIPYDFRWPTPAVWRERCWNAEDPRVFTPHVFGWGWSINLYQVARRLRLKK